MPNPPAPAAPVVPAVEEFDDDEETGAPTASAPPVAPVPPSPPAAAPPQAPAEPVLEVHQGTIVAATFEGLQNKHARRDTAHVPSVDADGNEVLLEIKLRAISNTAYDKLLDAYPPNREDQAKGAIWDRRKFPAALLEATCTSPKLTYEQWFELSTHENWSGGEFGDLFGRANRLCQGGLDVPFTGRG